MSNSIPNSSTTKSSSSFTVEVVVVDSVVDVVEEDVVSIACD